MSVKLTQSVYLKSYIFSHMLQSVKQYISARYAKIILIYLVDNTPLHSHHYSDADLGTTNI